MKVAIEQSLKETLEVDMDAINKRKQKRLAKAIIDEDLGSNNFGISRKIQKIMVEQHQQKKTRKLSQRDEEEEELLANEHRTKRRHKSTTPASARPPIVTSIPHRLKDLTQTDEDEGLIRVALQKNKITTLDAQLLKRQSKPNQSLNPRHLSSPLPLHD